MLRWNDAVLDRKLILLWVEILCDRLTNDHLGVKLTVIELHWFDVLAGHSARAVRYADRISAQRWYHTNKYPIYDTKQSDGEAPVL